MPVRAACLNAWTPGPRVQRRSVRVCAGAEDDPPADSLITSLKVELAELEAEQEEAADTAKAAMRKSERLVEKVDQLSQAAFQAVKDNKEELARKTLAQKAKVQEAIAKANERAQANLALASSLASIIADKQTALIAVLADAGHLQRSSSAGISSDDVIIGEPPLRERSTQDAVRSAGDRDAPSTGTAAPSSLSSSSSSPSASSARPDGYRTLSDRELQEKFAGLERESLERLFGMSATEGAVAASGIASSSNMPDWWRRGYMALAGGIFGSPSMRTASEAARELLLSMHKQAIVQVATPKLSDALVLVRVCTTAEPDELALHKFADAAGLDALEAEGLARDFIGLEQVAVGPSSAAARLPIDERREMYRLIVDALIKRLEGSKSIEGLEPTTAAGPLLVGLGTALALPAETCTAVVRECVVRFALDALAAAVLAVKVLSLGAERTRMAGLFMDSLHAVVGVLPEMRMDQVLDGDHTELQREVVAAKRRLDQYAEENPRVVDILRVAYADVNNNANLNVDLKHMLTIPYSP